MMETENEKNQHEDASQLEVSRPLSRADMRARALERIDRINTEFKDGFEFLENYPKSVTFFGSSVVNENNEFYKKAQSLAHRISSELKCAVVTGGGPGIMEAANRGAYEAEGTSLGITIKLPREQTTNPYLTDRIALQYFFARKVCLSFSAEVFIFFPGGYGTLDELFEILTLVQTRKIRSIPIVLVCSEFWKPFEKFLYENILSLGMIDDSDLSLFTIEDNEDKILDLIRNAPERNEY